MKLKKWIRVLSGMCAMLTMQMHVSALETQADTEALKTALIEYEWENYTQPKTRAKGIENSADLAWIYTSLDEFFVYYNQNEDGFSDLLSRIDVNSDYSVRHFYDDWNDFLDEWVAEKEELYGEISVVDAGDTFQLVDAAGNAVESFDKLYQFTYLNDEMSEEDREFWLSEDSGISEVYGDETVDGVNAANDNSYADNSSIAVNEVNENTSPATANYADAENAAADNANANDGNESVNTFSYATEEATEANTEEAEEPEEKGNTVPYFVAGVVVVAAAGIGGYFLYQKKKGV